MRIGIDARLWSESGVGRYTRNLVLQLQKIDKKNEYVLFVLSKNKEEILHYVQNDKFRIATADIRWHTIEEQIKFPSIINKENLDLVHFPYFSVPFFYKKPFVVTIHDLILHHFPTGQASTLPLPIYKLKLLGYRFIISQAAKHAKKIITVSNATKEEIVDHLDINKEKIVVMYEGIEDSLNSKLLTSSVLRGVGKTQNSKIQLKPKSYFLYVGNAYPHKNLNKLITAFSKFKDQELDAKLILVGKEDYFYLRLKEKVKKTMLGESVVFYGEVNDDELTNLYQNALALVAPSLMEGFGLPVLEAMANKCLVLASNILAYKEIADDIAIYFNPNNTEDLLEKMKAVYSNDTKHYSEKIQKGIERAKMFSWKNMTKETLKVYESCVSI